MTFASALTTKNTLKQLTELRIAFINERFGKQSKEDEKNLYERIYDFYKVHLNVDAIAFTASEGDEIVSVVVLLIQEKLANPTCLSGRYGEVVSVYTKPEHRGKGQAYNLINMLKDYAREHNIDRIDLKASKMGYPVYKKAGFEEVVSEDVAMRFSIK